MAEKSYGDASGTYTDTSNRYGQKAGPPGSFFTSVEKLSPKPGDFLVIKHPRGLGADEMEHLSKMAQEVSDRYGVPCLVVPEDYNLASFGGVFKAFSEAAAQAVSAAFAAIDKVTPVLLQQHFIRTKAGETARCPKCRGELLKEGREVGAGRGYFVMECHCACGHEFLVKAEVAEKVAATEGIPDEPANEPCPKCKGDRYMIRTRRPSPAQLHRFYFCCNVRCGHLTGGQVFEQSPTEIDAAVQAIRERALRHLVAGTWESKPADVLGDLRKACEKVKREAGLPPQQHRIKYVSPLFCRHLREFGYIDENGRLTAKGQEAFGNALAEWVRPVEGGASEVTADIVGKINDGPIVAAGVVSDLDAGQPEEAGEPPCQVTGVDAASGTITICAGSLVGRQSAADEGSDRPAPACECGGAVAGTPHSTWCPAR